MTIKVKDGDLVDKYYKTTGTGTLVDPFLGNNISKDWLDEVAGGNVAGYETIDKYGENPDIDTGTFPEDIWDFGGLYVFSSSADIDRISSSSALDTMDIEIQGLDSAYNLVTQTISLTGQTPVALTTSLLRVFRMKNMGTSDISGNVYCFVNSAVSSGVPNIDANVRAMIRNGNNQTLMMIYTVPAGKTLYYKQGYIALSRANDVGAEFTLRVRSEGGVFQTKRKIALNSGASSYWLADYLIARVIPEKTDIVFRCDEVTGNNTAVTGGFSGYLRDN